MRIRKPPMYKQRFVFPHMWRPATIRGYISAFDDMNHLVHCEYLIYGEVA